MTPDSHDPNPPPPTPPRRNSESVLGSDSAVGLATPPAEEVSSGSSIFDHHVSSAPSSFAEGAPNLMRGEREFPVPDAAADSEAAGEMPTDEAAAAEEEPDFASEEPAFAEEAASEAEAEAAAEVAVAEADHGASLPGDVFDAAGPTDTEPTDSVPDELSSIDDQGTDWTPDANASVEGDDADAMDFTVSQEGEGTAEEAQETGEVAPAEDWTAEPSFEAEPEPVTDGENALPPVSADDDQDALAGLGALAGGAVAGAALADDSPWTSNTTSEADGSSSYRPPAPPAAPKRDFVKLLLISYAVLVTVAAGLLWKRLNDRSVNEQRLESLPDVRTLKVGQVSTFDANIALPPGHRLKLGEKRRFGNIEVEATKVTRGMVSYEHPAGERWTLLPEGPVVKLWLRFRNVSKDQPIPPLDKYLVFSKTKIPGTEHFRTNSVLTTAAGRLPVGYVLTHDHGDKNVLKGQQLDSEIPPGGTLETFIPTTPDLDLPPGDLFWRVHLRKGFGKAGAGVTTLIEVAFSAKDVVDDGQG